MIKRSDRRRLTIFLEKNRSTRNLTRLSWTLLPRSRSGQVWIETVIYTLVGFVLIGLILSFALPWIGQLQDKAIIQQSIGIMKEIDSQILTMGSTGNQREVDLTIRKGDLVIDGINEKIIFEIETQSVYSELGREIRDGSVAILTQKKTGYNLVTLTIDYSSNRDLEFEEKDINKIISKSSTSYELWITNKGNLNGKTLLNIFLS